jgi:hypothetical protein
MSQLRKSSSAPSHLIKIDARDAPAGDYPFQPRIDRISAHRIASLGGG